MLQLPLGPSELGLQLPTWGVHSNNKSAKVYQLERLQSSDYFLALGILHIDFEVQKSGIPETIQ